MNITTKAYKNIKTTKKLLLLFWFCVTCLYFHSYSGFG